MGQAFRKLTNFFCGMEIKVMMVGLFAAGKTTILYQLHTGEVLPTRVTVGFNVEEVQYKNFLFNLWDLGAIIFREWDVGAWELVKKHYFYHADALIYVVDSLGRERIRDAKAEFQDFIGDPLMLNKFILVFANKQDMKGAMTPREVAEGLGLFDLENRKWHIQGTSAITGDGLYEGLEWLSSSIKEMRAGGFSLMSPSLFQSTRFIRVNEMFRWMRTGS